MITTEAWVLEPRAGDLKREAFAFDEIGPEEVLVEPLYGSWEANMSHALQRKPVDICRMRREPKVVIGNSGVVRVVRIGAKVSHCKPGDRCILFAGLFDEFGFLQQGRTYGYDAPGTIGLLARQTKLHQTQLLAIPADSRFSLRQWAIFSLRYLTAYNNWNLAFGCYRLQMSEQDVPHPRVWGWGGGSTLAELELAKLAGCRVSMFASRPDRLELLERRGIQPLDRREIPALNYDETRYHADEENRREYDEAEQAFLRFVQEQTEGEGVAIFVDYIGAPVSRASMRALSRQGVLTTAGWKCGMKISLVRAIECIERHTHVHTHYARLSDGLPAVAMAERTGWMPDEPERVWAYDEIPELARQHAQGELDDYFPVYQVNPE